jgi:hypothetical protein
MPGDRAGEIPATHAPIDSNRRNPTSFGISFQLLRKTDVCTHCSAALKAATAPTLASGKVLPPTPPFFIGGKNPERLRRRAHWSVAFKLQPPYADTSRKRLGSARAEAIAAA